MTFRLVLSALFGVALAAAATPACAGQTLFETVKDWKILKNTDDSGKWQCLLSRAYKDEDDESVSSIVIVPDGDKDAIALGYGNWDYGKEHKRIIVFLMGGRIVDLRSSWSAEGTQLGSSIPASLRPALLNAGELTLRFKDGDATFKVPGLPQAYEAVTRCNAPPPLPPQPRINAYMMGLLFEKVLAQCDVATTGRQRSQLEAKLAALRPEMAGIESEARRELAANPPAQLCPPPDKAATFARKLDLYTSLTPEAFAAELDREEAEKQAKAAADQKAAEQAAEAKAAEDKATAERKAAEEKALADSKAAEAKAADDKAAAERKAADDKAAADRKAAEAAAAEKPPVAPDAGSPPAEKPSETSPPRP